MILEKLKLKNFLIHKDSEIEFSPYGITAFIGDNGAGKSSIVEAIAFALYGTRKDRKKLQDYVRWGTRQASVELYFKIGSKRYKIERTIELTGKRATSSAQILVEKDGRFILDVQKNVDKELVKITKLTYRVFSKSSLVKQGEIEGLINLSPKERAKVFEDLLDLTIYQTLSDAYGKKRKELEIEKETLSASIQSTKDFELELKELKEKATLLEKQIEKQKTIIQTLNKQLKDIETKIEEKNLTLQENEQRLTQLKLLEQKLKQQEETLDKLNEEIKQIEDIKNQIKQLIPLVNQLEEKEQKLQKIQQLSILIEKLSDLQKKEKSIKENEKILKQLKSIYEEYTSKEKELKTLQENLLLLKKQEGEKAVLEKEQERLNEKLKNTKKEALQIAKELQKYKKIYKTLELNPVLIDQFIKNNEEDINRLEKEVRELSANESYVKQKGLELKEKIKNIQNLEGKCPTCERPLDQHSKEEILKEINAEIEKLREKYKNIQKKLKSAEEKLKTEKSIKELLNQFKKAFEQHQEAKKEKENIKTKLILLQRKLKEKNEIEEKIKSIQSFLEEHKENFQLYQQAQRLLQKENPEELNQKLKKLSEEITNLKKDVQNLDEDTLKKQILTLKEKKDMYIKLKAKAENEENIKKEIQKLEKSTKDLKKQIEIIKQTITDTSEIKKQIEKLKQQQKQLKEELEKEQEKLLSVNTDYTQITTLINEKQKQVEKIQRTEEKIKQLEEKISKYRKLEFALGREGIQLIIRKQALTQLPVIMNNIFSKFEFPFKQIKLTEDFDIFLLAPTLEREDRYVNVASISGGQKVALGLAIRIAIGNLLSGKTEFMILDEPTIHLDEQRREDLISMMISLKENEYVKQLIIITHDRELEDVADAIYFVKEGSVEPVE